MVGAALPFERQQVRLSRDHEAGEVGDVLAERQLAVDVQSGQRLEFVELLDQHLRALHGIPSSSVFVHQSRSAPVAS